VPCAILAGRLVRARGHYGFPVLLVCGEAVLDLISDGSAAGYQARPGGSPVNVAVGCARLGIATSLLGRLGHGPFGRMIRTHLTDAEVDLRWSVSVDEPVTLAIVTLDSAGQAEYHFYTDGTADWGWQRSELPDPLPEQIRALHVGSIASWRAPAADLIADLVARESQRGEVLISFDPNLRPALVQDPASTHGNIEQSVELADLVKVSVADLGWLYPRTDPDAAARRWARRGPALVVMTDGAKGARGYLPGRPALPVPASEVAVVDTVGAGDAFTAGLLAALADRGRLHRHGLDDLQKSELHAVLAHAGLVAALSCARPGADPPTHDRLDAELKMRIPRHPSP